MFESERKNIFYLFFLSAISFFSNLWVTGADLMEARNFVTAREMVVNGNWIVTTLNGQLRFEKPPFPTWLTAFVMKITGDTHSDWIARIPVAVASLLFVFLAYYLIKVLTKNNTLSFICAFVSSTMFMLMKMGKENSWDMYPYIFAMGTVLFFIRGLENHRVKEYLYGGLFLAMSLMSKGPVAVYGLILPFFIAYGITYGLEGYKKDWKLLGMGILLGIGLALIWPLTVILTHREYFISVMNKEKTTWSTKHTQGFFFYLDYFIYTGIWMFFAVATLFKKWMNKRVKDRKSFDFIYLWNILSLLLISLIAMKKKRYGIPIYMTTSLLVGYLVYYYWENYSWKRLEKSDRVLISIQSIVMGVVCLGVPILFFIKGFAQQRMGISYPVLMTIIFGGIGYLLWRAWGSRDLQRVRVITLGSGVFMLLTNLTTNWFIERDIRGRGVRPLPKFQEFKKEKNKLAIYSDGFNIIDVWNSGKEIKNLNSIPVQEREIWVLDTDGVLSDMLRSYRVVEKKEFYRYNKGKDILAMYRLQK